MIGRRDLAAGEELLQKGEYMGPTIDDCPGQDLIRPFLVTLCASSAPLRAKLNASQALKRALCRCEWPICELGDDEIVRSSRVLG